MNLARLNTIRHRNDLVKKAGNYFVGEGSDIIQELNSQGESVLFGIQHANGFYTIIGKDYVYYLTSSGKRGKISHREFSEELGDNGNRIGKGWLMFKLMYKSIVLKNNDNVWLYNADTMFSLWNIIAWLERNKWDPCLEEIREALRRDF